jgi:hypothetical protein
MAAENEPIDEDGIARLETEFAHASGVTCSAAYQNAIQAGLTVVVSEGDKIIEVSPDGKERIVKLIIGPSPAQPGTRYTIP